MRWKGARTALMMAAAVALGLNVVQALNGCASESPALNRVAEVVGIDPYPISDDGTKELSRFNQVFTTSASDPTNTRQLKQFRDAFKRIRATYVRPVPDAQLIDAAIAAVHAGEPEPGAEPQSLSAAELVTLALDGMTASLDPHSAYLDPDELRESELMTSGEFGGLGVQVTQEDGLIKVISPIEDTPADRVGLKPGDLITHLDGRAIRGMTLKEAVQAMRGAPGTPIRLTIQRGDQPSFDVAITRAVITIRPVRWHVENGVGYLRIVSFNEKVEEDVAAAMQQMRTQLGDNGKGLVLDLRNNPGGLLDQSLAVADDFLDDGLIVSIRGRDPRDQRNFAASPGDLAEGLPMVVLINSGSASASEIVAAALQDRRRATVMGRRSFGKGSVQTVMRLPVEGALKLTTALYYAPSGETIQARGVQPDIVLSETDSEDKEIQREADLPGALPVQGTTHHALQAVLEAKACPAVGEQKDHELGCAIAFVTAGSTDRFRASLGVRPPL